ncbi:hypothetical protein SEA_WESAK_27 [Microbacterium phage Wesak]|uniref:Uncharacterized protein n=1 Tax=Microbacterium phage Wesak TaxID=2653751 RepID=A0A5Q2WLB0_9CAUD|nr:hypothetical protein SEA_WESAK_27 [Microbacterium phage Wesak]
MPENPPVCRKTVSTSTMGIMQVFILHVTKTCSRLLSHGHGYDRNMAMLHNTNNFVW